MTTQAELDELNGVNEGDLITLARKWAVAARRDPPPSGLFLADDLDRIVAEIEKLKAALEEINRKYAAVMRDPPAWVNMTPEQLKWVREAWYGASLIARKALSEVVTT